MVDETCEAPTMGTFVAVVCPSVLSAPFLFPRSSPMWTPRATPWVWSR